MKRRIKPMLLKIIASTVTIGVAGLLISPCLANAAPPWNVYMQLFGTSLTIQSQTSPTAAKASLNINATFDSGDFDQNLVDNIHSGSTAVLYVGVEPAGSCNAGTMPVPPVGIPLATPEASVSGTYNYAFNGNDTAGNLIAANWQTSPTTSSGGSGNQTTTVTCPGGSSSTTIINQSSGSGNQQSTTSCDVSGGGSVIVSSSQTNTGNSSGGQGSEQLTFQITTQVANALPSPRRAVDLFIEYPNSNNTGDEGACVTLSSTSVSKVIERKNGQTTTVYSFSAD